MFQSDFLWGSASAAYQIEGGALIDGKGPSIWDEYSKIPGNTFKDTTGEVAIDFYHKFEEDINLMKEQGLKSYRFSISWPRILPEGKGEINEKGLEFYDRVIDTLIENDVEPLVTLYHWDLPAALQEEYGGWESRQIVDDFVNYATILFDRYKDKVQYWVTLNEQNIYTGLGYLYELHPPKVSDYQRFLVTNHHSFLANARTISEFRKIIPNGKIGPSFAYGPEYAKSEHPGDVLASENASEMLSYLWLDVYAKGKYPKYVLKQLEKHGYTLPIVEGDDEILKAETPDFMGLNYYQTATFQDVLKDKIETKQLGNTVQSESTIAIHDELFARSENDHLDSTDWGWTIDPSGLRVALRRITSRYDLPILITENGLGAYDTLEEDGSIHDEYRIEYLRQHVKAIEEAIDDGCEVLGYCTWSFQDLFSWLNGYAKRYGFVYVDRDEESEKELKRYKKDSFYWYKQVIETNGENLESPKNKK